jgi:hypothetical protein
MLEVPPLEPAMPDHNPELPLTPPTSGSGPVIDPSSTAVPAVPRPMAPAPPSATSSPWSPQFATPSAAPAGPRPVRTAPARARRAAAAARTRAVVGGTSVAAFLAILAAVAVHGDAQPASTVNTGADGTASGFDPGLVRPSLGQGAFENSPGGSSSLDPFGSSPGSSSGTTTPYSRGFSGGGFPGGGFSATPGTGGASAHTRSHGS